MSYKVKMSILIPRQSLQKETEREGKSCCCLKSSHEGNYKLNESSESFLYKKSCYS